jgi:pyruvate formate lyase activating enzyme
MHTGAARTMGLVFDIQRFSIHDGPGIRTTVFLKGCPLRCTWCHNPESQSRAPEVFFSADKCIGCRACHAVCPHGCHRFDEGIHVYHREDCDLCGQCLEQCAPKALERVGRSVSVDEVIEQVLRDRPFYRDDGGLTVSGGEPMSQAGFTIALLQAAKQHQLHTCIETCGQAPWKQFADLLPLVDLFLYDLKETQAQRHLQYTGVENHLILQNLLRLDQAGAKLVLRCPLVPGVNDRPDHLAGIATVANSLHNLVAIDLLAYHALGRSKARRLGRQPAEAVADPTPAMIEGWRQAVAGQVRVPVRS